MKLSYNKQFLLVSIGVLALTVIAITNPEQLWLRPFTLIVILNLPFTYILDQSSHRWYFRGKPQSYAFWTELPSFYIAFWLPYLVSGYLIMSIVASTFILISILVLLFIRKPDCETCFSRLKCKHIKQKEAEKKEEQGKK